MHKKKKPSRIVQKNHLPPRSREVAFTFFERGNARNGRLQCSLALKSILHVLFKVFLFASNFRDDDTNFLSTKNSLIGPHV